MTHVTGQDVSVEGASLALSVTTGNFPSSTTTGNCVVACVSWYTGTGAVAPTVTDSKGNSYTKLKQADNPNESCAIYLAKNITGGAGHTVTATVGTSTLQSIAASEYTGQNTTTQAGGTGTGTGTGTTAVSAGIVTPATGDLAIACATHSTANSPTITAGTGWTRRGNIVGNTGMPLASEDQAGAGSSISGDFTFGANVNAWAAAVAVIQQATATSSRLLASLGVGR